MAHPVKEQVISILIQDIFTVGENGFARLGQDVLGNPELPYLALRNIIQKYADFQTVIPFSTLKVDTESEWFEHVYTWATREGFPDFNNIINHKSGFLLKVSDIRADTFQLYFTRTDTITEGMQVLDKYLETNMVNYVSSKIIQEPIREVDTRIVCNFIVNMLTDVILAEKEKRKKPTAKDTERLLEAIYSTVLSKEEIDK
ncbi:hypothetical protein [Solibacillus sp. NPDC093137]|uniref:hypothetical protein n=1 Tax=Solibacillus sp. NPDC093137 TaxID=3390678 RepID=UPI003D07A7C6